MRNQVCSAEEICEVIRIGSDFDREELTVLRCFEKDPRDRIVCRFGNFNQNLLITGAPALVVKNVVPISEETIGEGGVTLFEAVRKCVLRSPFSACYAEAGLDDNVLTYKYLMAFFKALNINYAATAIVFGIDLSEAKKLSELRFDKYTAAIFSIHYKINFTMRGADGDEYLHEVKINALIKKLALETFERCKEQLKRELKLALFNIKKNENYYLKIESVSADKIEELAKLICELKISPVYGSWLLSFDGGRSKDYYKNLLRRLWKSDNGKGYLMYWAARREVRQLCENLLRNSIKFKCTTDEFVVAFLTASEIAIHLCNVSENSITKTRGWLASEMYKCFINKEAGDL